MINQLKTHADRGGKPLFSMICVDFKLWTWVKTCLWSFTISFLFTLTSKQYAYQPVEAQYTTSWAYVYQREWRSDCNRCLSSPSVRRLLRLGLAVRHHRLKRRSGCGTNGPAVAVASWTAEISREIDTDKSHTLRLPGRRLSAEEAVAVPHPRNGGGFLGGEADKEARCAGGRFIWLMCLRLQQWAELAGRDESN